MISHFPDDSPDERLTMAVREFQDERGSSWRVWCILPESIHPVTRAEDYLADCYQLGWLVFETGSGEDKRRLCPFPRAWENATDEELQALLQQAEVVPSRKLGREMNDAEKPLPRAVAAEPRLESAEKADLTDLKVVRTFRYPGGRIWSAAIAPHSDIAVGPVLRFTAGARTLDLPRFPRDWPDLPDEQLIELLRLAGERPLTKYTPETPRRRHHDPPA